MADQIKALVAQGVQALKAGGEVAKQATAEIQNDATDPGLKSALQQGNQVAEQWAQRIQRAAQEAGPSEETGNPIMEAHYKVSQMIRQKAPDAVSRDLGIIASGQLALHYWVAAFGTLGAYASKAGLTQTAQDMQTCLSEAKQADSQQTELAQKIMAAA